MLLKDIIQINLVIYISVKALCIVTMVFIFLFVLIINKHYVL